MQKKNRNIEKIAFKFVQMKFLAMHLTNRILRIQRKKDERENIYKENRRKTVCDKQRVEEEKKKA